MFDWAAVKLTELEPDGMRTSTQKRPTRIADLRTPAHCVCTRLKHRTSFRVAASRQVMRGDWRSGPGSKYSDEAGHQYGLR